MNTAALYKTSHAMALCLLVLSLAAGVAQGLRSSGRLPGMPPPPLAQYERLLAAGELRLAARQHHLAERIDPSSFRNAPELAAAMRRGGDLQGEIDHYRFAVERWPRDPATHLALARAFIRQRRFEEALAALTAARRVAPGDFRVDVALGDARLEQGQFAAAARAYADAVRQAPGDAGAHNSLGIAFARAGEPARAAAAFAEAARLDPDPQYAANLERARRDAAGAVR